MANSHKPPRFLRSPPQSDQSEWNDTSYSFIILIRPQGAEGPQSPINKFCEINRGAFIFYLVSFIFYLLCHPEPCEASHPILHTHNRNESQHWRAFSDSVTRVIRFIARYHFASSRNTPTPNHHFVTLSRAKGLNVDIR